MLLTIEIERVHPIGKLTFNIELNQPSLMCIVGKNGAGKTTFAKSILNLALADTFVRTSSDGIFDAQSKIRYEVDGSEHIFTYDATSRALTSKALIPDSTKNLVSVEMPAPYGQRFTFFRALADADDEIRRAIVLGQYTKPAQLIDFLSSIYGERRFDNLVEVSFRGGTCCCIVLPEQRYIREDYFSSGEYFLIRKV